MNQLLIPARPPRPTDSPKVFDWNSTSADWSQLGTHDYEVGLGSSVALSADGTRLAVRKGYHGPATITLEYVESAWVQLGASIMNEGGGGYASSPLKLNGDGSRIAVGAPM